MRIIMLLFVTMITGLLLVACDMTGAHVNSDIHGNSVGVGDNQPVKKGE